MRKQTLLLSAWLLLPIAVIAGLSIWIWSTLSFAKPMDDAPPVGQGAGDTGGANAVGEIFSGGVHKYIENRTGPAQDEHDRQIAGTVPAHQLGRGLDLAVTDTTGTARPGSPVYAGLNGSEPVEMFLSQTGAWTLKLSPETLAPYSADALLVTFTVKVSGETRTAEPVPVPLIDPSTLAPGQRPQMKHKITAWSD